MRLFRKLSNYKKIKKVKIINILTSIFFFSKFHKDFHNCQYSQNHYCNVKKLESKHIADKGNYKGNHQNLYYEGFLFEIFNQAI